VTDHFKWHGYGMVVSAAVCWGIMATIAKLLFRDRGVDPLLLVVVRAYLATLTLFGVLAAVAPGQLRIRRRDAWLALIVGVGGLLTNNFLYFEALHLTSVATALLLHMLEPVVATIAAYLILGERRCFRCRSWAGGWSWRVW
jgi:drug/metabolite transporter (DMT)-like permease